MSEIFQKNVFSECDPYNFNLKCSSRPKSNCLSVEPIRPMARCARPERFNDFDCDSCESLPSKNCISKQMQTYYPCQSANKTHCNNTMSAKKAIKLLAYYTREEINALSEIICYYKNNTFSTQQVQYYYCGTIANYITQIVYLMPSAFNTVFYLSKTNVEFIFKICEETFIIGGVLDTSSDVLTQLYAYIDGLYVFFKFLKLVYCTKLK